MNIAERREPDRTSAPHTIWLQRLYVLFFIELRQPLRASGWLFIASELAMGDPAGPEADVDVA